MTTGPLNSTAHAAPAPSTTTDPKPKPAITIRPAHPSDAAAIAALGTAVFKATFEESGCTPSQLQTYLDESYTPTAIHQTLTSPLHTTLVATPSEPPSTTPNQHTPPIQGFALLNRASSADEPCVVEGRYAAPVELQRLYVAMEAQGRGVGRALVVAAEGVMREEGFETAWLGVWERNGRAQALYRSLGYEFVGSHVFDVGGDLQTDLIMVKAL